MANAQWPASLKHPTLDQIDYGPLIDGVIRTPMDFGPAKLRRRFTAVPEAATFSLQLYRSQVQTLQDFVAITLKDTLPFDWYEFRKPDRTLVTYRFIRRPRFVPMQTGMLWLATVELELLTTYQGTFLLDIQGLST